LPWMDASERGRPSTRRTICGTGQPAQDAVGRDHRARFAGRNFELHQGHEAPMRACPFLVRMAPESAVRQLAREQGPNERPFGRAAQVLVRGLPHEISTRHAPNGRFVRCQEPVDPGHRRSRPRAWASLRRSSAPASLCRTARPSRR
jgi:hypothetical protein